MNINYKDRSKPITAEDLIRRYNLDGLAKDRKAIQTNKNGLDKTDTLLNEFVSTTTQSLQELQDQVDGKMTTWFFSGVPTLENQPANEWVTEEEKKRHIGDLYYDKDTGKAYRWIIDNNEYIWLELSDSDLSEVLAIANSAKDTADSKRRVFVEQPFTPYDVGDIWIKEDTDLYRCRASRSKGEYSEVDWILATNYTDDSYALSVEAILNQFKNEVKTDYATKVQLETTADSINANVKTNTAEIRNITETIKEKDGISTIYIEDALEISAIECNVEGKNEQTTRSGKNLFDKDNANILEAYTGNSIVGPQNVLVDSTNSSTLYISCEPNTTYTISRTRVGKRFQVAEATELPAIGSSIRNATPENFDNELSSITYTTSSEAKYLLVFYSNIGGNNYQNNNGYTEKELRETIQIEKGFIATEFEQYGASPSPNYPSVINTVKGIKNLFDIPYTEDNKLTKTATRQDDFVITDYYAQLEAGKKYTFSCKTTGTFGKDGTAQTQCFLMLDKGFETVWVMENKESYTFTATVSGKYYLRYDVNVLGETHSFWDFQIEEGTIAHTYVPYGSWIKTKITNDIQNKELLTNLNKPNLFNEKTLIQGTINNASITSRVVSLMHKVSKGYTFTAINKNTSKYAFSIGFTSSNVQSGNTFINETGWITDSIKTVSANNEGYMFIQIKKIDDSVLIPSEVVDTDFILYEGYEPYYELVSIEDTKDNLEFLNGILIKRTGKVILDGSETIIRNTTYNNGYRYTIYKEVNGNILCTEKNSSNPKIICDYFSTISPDQTWGSQNTPKKNGISLHTSLNSSDGKAVFFISYESDETATLELFKDFLAKNPITIYYELVDEKIIQLSPTNIILFDGVNQIEMFNVLKTNINIKYYRNTPLSKTYVTKSEMETSLDINNNSIEAKVTSKINANYTKTQEQMEILEDNTNNLANRIENNETNLANNYYSKENIEQLLITSSNGLTNTFSEAGGNNIFRNTNFSAQEVLELGQKYEYWYGDVVKSTNNNSVNGSSILLQSGNLNQETIVANGTYTISFYYKKINPLANCYVRINNKQYELSNDTYSLFQTGVKDEQGVYITEPIIVNDNHLKIEFITDVNNSCEIYDIMCNFGSIKLAYSQNQNETVTDTVNISKGITITSSESEVKFTANNDGIRTKTANGEVITDFTDKGMNTKEAVVRDEATLVGVLRQKVGEQVWDSLI